MRMIRLSMAVILTLTLTFALLELGASLIMYHRNKDIDIFRSVFQYRSIAILSLFDLAFSKPSYDYRYELKPSNDPETFATSTPSPFWYRDENLGYSTKPGRYIFNFHKGSLRLPTIVTILNNGSRFTGNENLNAKSNIYVFGDSFIFGQGVNDEQTFSALLQSGMPFYNVHLYANGGYSHVNALARLNQLKDTLKKEDILILGYAPFYKVRNVAAPSRLKEYGVPNKLFDAENYPYHLKATIDQHNNLKVEKTPLFCSFNTEYCKTSDPSLSQQNQVTASIINDIALKNPGITMLLVFDGLRDDKVFSKLNQKVKIVYARPEDFDYFMRDNVSNFDGHPGPYWHYAIYDKLKAVISKIQ